MTDSTSPHCLLSMGCYPPTWKGLSVRNTAIAHCLTICSFWKTRWTPKSRLYHGGWQSWVFLISHGSMFRDGPIYRRVAVADLKLGYLTASTAKYPFSQRNRRLPNIQVYHQETSTGRLRWINKCAGMNHSWNAPISVGSSQFPYSTPGYCPN